MEGKCKTEDFEDPDFFISIKNSIEKELLNLQKIVNNISQLRVATAYLESDLIMTIDASTWGDISDLIGLSSHIMDTGFGDEMQTYGFKENDDIGPPPPAYVTLTDK